MSNNFYDGIFTEANRTNEASGRSWHIPRENETFERDASDREPSRMHIALGILGLIFVAAALIGAVTR
jgi:hypothetical protein